MYQSIAALLLFPLHPVLAFLIVFVIVFAAMLYIAHIFRTDAARARARREEASRARV